jgi:hypothetical protein
MKERKRHSITEKLIKEIDPVVSTNTEVSQEKISNSNFLAVKSNPKS